MIRNLILGLTAFAVLAASGERSALGQYRSYDGTGNNPLNFDWGAAGTQLVRYVPSDYGDEVSTPAGASRPGARQISNDAMDQLFLQPNTHLMSAFVYTWGQFVDHNIDLTGSADPAEPFNIPVPLGDEDFDPGSTGTQEIPFFRSIYDPTTGTDSDHPRQQINQITAYLDGSAVYGSSEARALALRSGVGGRLLTGPGNLLPLNTLGIEMATGGNPNVEQFYAAGDVRANEQVGLTALHTLMMREHNYQADRIAPDIAAANPGFTSEQLDEAIYQQARALVGAEIQSITYREFLPALLGPNYALGVESTYDSGLNPGIFNVFATAGYRVGHTMLPPQLLRMTNDGEEAPDGHMSLRDAFFKPDSLADPWELEYIFNGLAAEQQEQVDMHIIDDVRNFLFGPPGAGGFDLAALNIQRGRDHGLPDYNTVRVAFGLDPAESFADVTSDPDAQAALQSLYGDVSDMDVWVAAIAEDHEPGAAVGELVATILWEQFRRVRDGDNFWYRRNPALADDLAWLDSIRLSDIIRRNTSVANMQNNVFFMVPEPSAILLALVVAGMGFAANRRRRFAA